MTGLGAGIVTDRYTYARFESEPWVLFDNQADPSQMKNLATDPRHASLATRLDAQLAALMREHKDAWSFNRRERVEEGGKLYRHATFYSVDEYLKWAAANPDKSIERQRSSAAGNRCWPLNER